MQKIILLASLAIFLSFVGCKSSDTQQAPDRTGQENTVSETVWLTIVPVQCMGNAWEKDWLESSGKEAKDFPRENEKEIIIAFYKKQGARVTSAKMKQTHDMVCDACSCPRGDTVWLEVAAEDEKKLTEMGFGPEGE